MKILLISDDKQLLDLIGGLDEIKDDKLIFISSPQDPVELLSNILSSLPGLIIFDNDFVESDSVKIIKSIRKVNCDVPIIFISTDLPFQLGSQISQLKIHYSSVKPISILEISESIKSIRKIVTN